MRKPKKNYLPFSPTGNRQEKPSNHRQVVETPSTTTNRNAFMCQEMEQRRSERNGVRGVCVCCLGKGRKKSSVGSMCLLGFLKNNIGSFVFANMGVQKEKRRCTKRNCLLNALIFYFWIEQAH